MSFGFGSDGPGIRHPAFDRFSDDQLGVLASLVQQMQVPMLLPDNEPDEADIPLGRVAIWNADLGQIGVKHRDLNGVVTRRII